MFLKYCLLKGGNKALKEIYGAYVSEPSDGFYSTLLLSLSRLLSLSLSLIYCFFLFVLCICMYICFNSLAILLCAHLNSYQAPILLNSGNYNIAIDVDMSALDTEAKKGRSRSIATLFIFFVYPLFWGSFCLLFALSMIKFSQVKFKEENNNNNNQFYYLSWSNWKNWKVQS